MDSCQLPNLIRAEKKMLPDAFVLLPLVGYFRENIKKYILHVYMYIHIRKERERKDIPKVRLPNENAKLLAFCKVVTIESENSLSVCRK